MSNFYGIKLARVLLHPLLVISRVIDQFCMEPIGVSSNTGPANKACTWFGEVCCCSSLTLLPGPAWVLLSYVLHTLFAAPVDSSG